MDLVLKNGYVMTPRGAIDGGWVAIDGQRIAAIGGPRVEPPVAAEVVDLAGKPLLPGVIDPHTHPGNYGMLRDELASVTRSAARGGVTTIIGIVKSTRMGGEFKELVTAGDVGSYTDVFDEGRACIDRTAVVDVAFTFIIMNDLHAAEIPHYAEELGVTTFKFFPSSAAPTRWHASIGTPSTGDDGTIFLALRNISRIGGLASFHPENLQVARVLEQDVRSAGRDDLDAWERRSPGFLEAYDVRKMAFFAEQTGATIYPVHVNSKEGVAEIARVKRQGIPMYAETCPRYLVLTKHYAARPPALAKTAPPLRDHVDQEMLWEALRNGTLDTVGSDHSPMSLAMKAADQGIWGAKAGFGDVGTLLPIMLSEGVNRGRITLERLTQICCENPARVFGLYPRKGVIQVGADADLVAVDLAARRTVPAADPGGVVDFSPYAGMELQGWPVLSVLRGRLLLRDGEVAGPPWARYLPRTVGARELASVEA